MPTYGYKCKACRREFETEQKFSDEPLVRCPYCRKNKLVRLISGAGLVFKGSGFYLTDYRKQAVSGAESGSAPAKEATEKGKSEAAGGSKSDSKTEPGSESKHAEKPHSKKKK